MATIQIHYKTCTPPEIITTTDIITARTPHAAHMIIDSKDITIRIRLDPEEATYTATKLVTPPNL